MVSHEMVKNWALIPLLCKGHLTFKGQCWINCELKQTSCERACKEIKLHGPVLGKTKNIFLYINIHKGINSLKVQVASNPLVCTAWAEAAVQKCSRQSTFLPQINLCTIQENDLSLFLRCGQSENNILTHKHQAKRLGRETKRKI